MMQRSTPCTCSAECKQVRQEMACRRLNWLHLNLQKSFSSKGRILLCCHRAASNKLFTKPGTPGVIFGMNEEMIELYVCRTRNLKVVTNRHVNNVTTLRTCKRMIERALLINLEIERDKVA